MTNSHRIWQACDCGCSDTASGQAVAAGAGRCHAAPGRGMVGVVYDRDDWRKDELAFIHEELRLR